MYSLATIKSMNRTAARQARGVPPFVARHDGDERVFSCPTWGDRRLKSWYLITTHFVDNSGFGSDNEPALTMTQFLRKVKQGRGYAITSTGQFQVYVGEFIKVTPKQRRRLEAVESTRGALSDADIKALLA